MHKKLLHILALAIIVASTLVGCSGGTPCSLDPTILSITGGEVLIMKEGTNDWADVYEGMELEVGDALKTGGNSSAEITFFDGSTMELKAETEIKILSLDIVCSTGVTTITLEQMIGTTISRVTQILDPASSYEVETPSGAAGVRGSVMIVRVTEDGTTFVTNQEGNIYAKAQGEEVQVPVGQTYIINPGQPPRPIMISAGEYHTLGLKSDGTVLVAGDNIYGECNVTDWENITQVAAGYYHSAGLKSDGTVVAVGWNYHGECDVTGWANITQVATGVYHTVGLKSDGTVVAVGDNNSYGQCDITGWTGITQVSASLHTVGLKSDGTVVAVGNNYSGQCYVGNWTDIVQVSAGYIHTVGLKSDGTVVAAGDNYEGQRDVSNWTDIIEVSAGYDYTVGLKSDGTVVAVGGNYWGQLYVTGWADIVQVSAGYWHTVGLKSDGTVVAVGYNNHGQCNVTGWNLK